MPSIFSSESSGDRPPATIADLDVKRQELEAEAAQLWAERDRRIAFRRGQLAEQRHQFLDLDADSVIRPAGFCCPNCPPRDGISEVAA